MEIYAFWYGIRHLVVKGGGSKSGLFFGTALQYKSSSPIKMWCIIYCVLHKLKVIKNNFQCQKTVLELHFSISFDSDLEFWQNIDWIIFRWKSDLYLTAIFNVNIKIFMSLLLWIWDRHPKLFKIFNVVFLKYCFSIEIRP